MGIFLRELCRLCGENNVKGVKLFDDKTKLYSLVNKYLPVELKDDEILPRTICPSCHIHLEDTALFIDLIKRGQEKLDALYLEELARINLKKTLPFQCEKPLSLLISASDRPAVQSKEDSINDILNGINQSCGESNGFQICNISSQSYCDNISTRTEIDVSQQAATCEVSCLDHPVEQTPTKRKRGRPKKSEAVSKKEESTKPLERSSRARKQPVRFSESVHGEELDNVLYPENTLRMEVDRITSDVIVTEEDNEDEGTDVSGKVPKENFTEYPEGIIGWIQSKNKDGKTLGSVTVTRRQGYSGNKMVTRLECIVCKSGFIHKSHLLRHLLERNCGTSDITIDDICPVNTAAVVKNINSFDSTSLALSNKKNDNVCLICQKIFPTRCSLVYHEEKEHTYHIFACGSCDKHFKHRLLLLRHQRCHQDSRPYRCDICPNVGFKYLSNLQHHQRSHSDKRFVCSFCLSSFTSKRSLEFHIRVHLGYKPFQCEVCQKDFSQKNNLQEHMRIHSGKKPFACETCNKMFKTSSQLKTHMLIHSDVKQHTCDICKKSFRHKDSWCAHVRRHTGEKPYSCTHCGKSFLEGTSVRKHERTHTGEKRFACKHCDKPFTDCSNLNKHRKKVHSEGIESSLERVIYLNLDLPQELNQLDLSNIDETNTNTISALNLALSDMQVDSELHLSSNPLGTKTLPIVFKAFDEPAIKDKDLNLALSDIRNQLDATNQMTVPIVLKAISDNVNEKDGPNQLPMFSEESMPLVLKSLESTNGPGKDMPALGLDNDIPETDSTKVSLRLSLPDSDPQLQVGQHSGDGVPLSLAIDSQNQIQELKDLSGLVDSSRQIVTDGQGVPIKITMSDGTQLQVTTPDGESLEVMTSDGVSIPVRLSATDFVLPNPLPNIDALTVEGALSEFSHLGQDYEIQFDEGQGIKLLATTDDQTIKLLPPTDDQSIKLLTSAAEAHGITELLNSSDATERIKLLSSANDGTSIELISSGNKLAASDVEDDDTSMEMLSSTTGSSSISLLSTSETSMKLITSTTSTNGLSSPSQIKWTLHE